MTTDSKGKKHNSIELEGEDLLFLREMASQNRHSSPSSPTAPTQAPGPAKLLHTPDTPVAQMDSNADFDPEDATFIEAMNTEFSEESSPTLPESLTPLSHSNVIEEPKERIFQADDDRLFVSSMEELPTEAPTETPEEKTPQSEGPAVSRRLRSVIAGKMSPDRVIDLHRLNRNEAKQYMANTLKEISQFPEIILIIVGKGIHSKGAPVLREEIPVWCNDEFSEHIGSWQWAPGRLGGSGAVLVVTTPNFQE